MKTAKRTKVESLKHKDKRANIPTEELRDFVKDEEREPKDRRVSGAALCPRSFARSATRLERQGRAGPTAARSARGTSLHSGKNSSACAD